LRILSVTAGAGGMYCGSCLRDNVLAGELQARGHDVTLLPVYTPTRTDEENVSESQVFFSGISVYLEQNFALFRKTPAILDFVWDTPAVIRAATGRGVSVDPEFLGDMTVSMLRGEQGNQAKEFRKLLRHLKAQPAFDVVMLPTSLLASLAPRAGGPDRVHALGRGPLPRRPGDPLQEGGEVADRLARPGRDALRRDERLLRRVHGQLPRPAAAADRHGADRHPLRRLRAGAGR
jgi:hypothetical protein